MPIYWGSITNQNSTNQNSDAIDRACRDLCNIPEGLFRDFAVPVGMDRDLAIHIIMREHGLAPLYRPDPYWMVDAIKYWVQESMPIWEKLYSTTQLKYNPIWNTDVQERTTDVRTTDRDTTQDRTAVNRGKSGQTMGQVMTGDYHETGSTELPEPDTRRPKENLSQTIPAPPRPQIKRKSQARTKRPRKAQRSLTRL